MPKIELHLHLEGTIRPPTALRLANRHGAPPPPAQHRFTDFDGFLASFLGGLELLRTAEDFADITEAMAIELANQHVVYAEVTSTPYNHHRRGVDLGDYCEGLDEGRRRARKHGVEIGWILDIPRELEPPDSLFTVEYLLGGSAPEGVVGLGLGGPETGWPAHLFADSFRRAKATGLASLPHAGETEGAVSVWSAIRDLAADRIGHGIRAADDPQLMAHLAERAIPLEVCMTSNVRTGVVADLASHPIRRLYDAGIPISINTDDPAYFYTTLSDELQAAHEHHAFDIEELALIQHKALATSHAPASARERFTAEMAEWRAAIAPAEPAPPFEAGPA